MENKQKEEALYKAAVESYFENAFWQTIKSIDNSLLEILRFSLTIVTVETLILSIAETTGKVSSINVVFFLSSVSAFVISSLIVLYGYTRCKSIDLDPFLDVTTILYTLENKITDISAQKKKFQQFGYVVFFIGIILLFVSIVSIINVIYNMKL